MPGRRIQVEGKGLVGGNACYRRIYGNNQVRLYSGGCGSDMGRIELPA